MIAARQIAFGKAGGAAKPYKARLEYLESTGTQYVNTGVVPDTQDIRIEITYANGSGHLFGSRMSSSFTNNNQMWSAYASTTSVCRCDWVNSSTGISVDSGAKTIVFESNSTGSSITYNGTSTTGGIKATNNLSMIIFGVNTNGTVSVGTQMTLYSFKMWKSDTLVRSLIPVLDNDLVPCMYDEVSGEFFYNQGTGEFIAGPVVDDVDYTARDYIQDGLVAMWDGIENAGFGVHDPNATVWKDLVGSRDLTLTSISSFENNCLVAVSPYGIAADGAELISDVGQTEMVAKTESYNKYYLHYYVYAGSYHCISRRNMFLCCALNISVVGAYRYGLEGSASLTTKASVSVLKPTGGYGEIYKNAVNINSDIYSVAVESEAPATISVKAHGTTTRYYNIRVYNRALTAEEIAYNYSIDKARFNLP